MKDRSLWGHTLWAVGCVALAYVAWTRPNITDKDDAVVLLPGDADTLTAVDWQDPETHVFVQRLPQKDDKGASEVSITRLQPPSPPELFPGSEAARQLLSNIAPLMAARDLGPIDANQRTAFGLDAPKIKLTLHFGERQREVAIGNTTFGSGDYYVLGPGERAYLLRAASVSALAHGGVRLQDREVVGLRREKFNRLLLTQQGRSKTFVQRHPDMPTEAFFADAAEPDRKRDAVGPWAERLLRMRVVSFAEKLPAGEAAVSISLFWDSTQKATLRIWPHAGTGPADASGAGAGAIVDTPRFKKPVVVSKASFDGVMQDLDVLFEASAVQNKGP